MTPGSRAVVAVLLLLASASTAAGQSASVRAALQSPGTSPPQPPPAAQAPGAPPPQPAPAGGAPGSTAVVPNIAVPNDLHLPHPAHAMTLEEALTYARANQPSLVAARARLAGVQAQTGIPRALYLPRVGVSVQAYEGTSNNSTGRYTATYDVDIPRIGATPVGPTGWSPSTSTWAGVGLRQEIFDFGRITALEQVADAAFQAERGVADAMRLDVLYAVENAYYAVQTAKGVLGAAEAAYQRSKLNFDMANAGVRVGLRDPIELTRAESDLARFDVARVRARAGLVASQGVYAAVVGVPETLLDTAGNATPALASPALEDAFRSAMENDPILRERRAREEEQKATTRSIAAELRPDISLTSTLSGGGGGATPSTGYLQPGNGLLPNVPNWDVGLVLTWPLIDFGVKARENASQALEIARRAEVDEQVQRLKTAVQSAYVGFIAAEQALPALEKTFVAATANYAQAEARFRNELGSSVELADAQALLTGAEVDVTIGRFEVLRARAALARAIAENL